MADWNSMSGFGEGQAEDRDWRVTVEVRTVNTKGLDVRVRTQPRSLAWEHAVTGFFQARLARGKVDVFLQAESRQPAGGAIDWAAVDRLRALRWQLRTRLDELPRGGAELAADPDPVRGLPEEVLLAACEAAFGRLQASRQEEGAGLQRIIRQQLDGIAAACARLRVLREEEKGQRDTDVRARVADLAALGLEPLEEQKILAEVAQLLLRSDITEELDRIDVHLEAARRLIDDENIVGRRLDILAQEFGREAHTAAAKSSLPAARTVAIELRNLVEQLREQVQNIE